MPIKRSHCRFEHLQNCRRFLMIGYDLFFWVFYVELLNCVHIQILWYHIISRLDNLCWHGCFILIIYMYNYNVSWKVRCIAYMYTHIHDLPHGSSLNVTLGHRTARRWRKRMGFRRRSPRTFDGRESSDVLEIEGCIIVMCMMIWLQDV